MSRLVDLARALLPAPAVRADAVTQHGGTQAVSGAALSNALSGLGGSRDSGAAARPNLHRQYLTDEELIALLRGGLYRRIVTLKPLWATAREWRVTDDTSEERPLDAELKRLKVRRTFRRADIWARALGESRVLLVTDDPAPLHEPLEASKVRALHRLEVLDRREFTPLEFNDDPFVGPVGEPTLYHVHPRRAGLSTGGYRVHASRLLRFYGDELPPSEEGWSWPHWGADAVGQTLWDGMRNLAMTGAAGARLAQELSVAVFQVNGSKSAGDQGESFLSRIRALNIMKSISNAVLVFDGEDYRRVSANPSGFKDLSEHAERQLATMTGTPLALLVGLAPGGLNTDGESWQVMWFKDVAAYRDDRYRDPFGRIVELLYWSERKGVPDHWDVEFLPLAELSEKEKAEIRAIHTQSDVHAIMEGILSPHEARSRYTQPGGFQTELQPVDEIEPSPGTPDNPQAEEAMRRLIEGELGQSRAPDADREADRESLDADDFRGDAVDPGSGVIVLIPAPAPSLSIPVPLERENDPHVTLLYVGRDLTDEAVAEVVEATREVARGMDTDVMRHGRVVALPPGEDGTPVVVEFDTWPLERAHGELLRRLAHVITARQHARFRPHLTLGYAGELTPEQLAQVVEVDAEKVTVPVAALEVRRGGELLATIPVGG